MTDAELYFSLLRVSATQALRSAGLTSAKPSVVDAFTDLLSRHLILLGTTTRDFAEAGGRSQAELVDVRLALEHVGLLRPIGVFADPEDEDDGAVEALLEWFRGPQAAEMRRVAGFVEKVPPAATAVAVGGGKSDEWFSTLKKVSERRGNAT